MTTIPYLQFDVRKKDTNWCNAIITNFRFSNYKAILDYQKCEKNRQIINSGESLEFLRKMFKNPEEMENKGYEFSRIAIMERFKNIIISEALQQEIKAYVDAQDPSLVRLKKEDKNLLMNRKLVELSANSLKDTIGVPRTKLKNDQFHGNYDDFNSFAFDTENEMDINTFFDVFYQLDVESDFQKIIDHTFNVNEIIDLVPDFREDIMATKMIAYRVFMNISTGMPTFRRIQPEKIFRIKGNENSKHEKSDIAVGYEEIITVNEFLKRAGDIFDFVNNINYLISGVVHNNSGLNISNIVMEDKTIISTGNQNGETVSYATFLNYKVQVGYMEFKSIDSDYYKITKNKEGNPRSIPLGKDDDKFELEVKGYPVVATSKERTYFANYMNTGPAMQYIINYGRVYLQETEGSEDEISGFTLKYHYFPGITFAEIAKPWIDVAAESFHKFKYLLRKAKEDGTAYNLDSLQEIAKKMLGSKGEPTDITNAFLKFEDSVNEVYAFPRNEDGSIVGTQGDINRKIERNFDSKFKSFTDIITFCVEQIKAQTGINDLRSGESPTTNDVFKLEKASLEKANNVTYYMNYMFDRMFQKTGTSIISLTIDSIRFKQSLACNYIKQIIGDEGLTRLGKLPKISPHRMDIFVMSFANYQDRIRVVQDTQIALQQKLISFTDKVLIDSVNDFRKARKLLVYREQAAKVQTQKDIQAQRDYESMMEDKKASNRMNEINAKGSWEVKKMQVQAEGFKEAAEANNKGRIDAQNAKSEKDKDNLELQNQLKQQEAFGIQTNTSPAPAAS